MAGHEAAAPRWQAETSPSPITRVSESVRHGREARGHAERAVARTADHRGHRLSAGGSAVAWAKCPGGGQGRDHVRRECLDRAAVAVRHRVEQLAACAADADGHAGRHRAGAPPQRSAADDHDRHLGYNAALAARGVYLWRPSLLLPVLGALVSVSLTEFFPKLLGIPALTAPFVLACWLLIALGSLERRFSGT
ncbi:MAG: urea transporter [Gammaproteobacteria bacterium]|nr:urea transporter [Gammaproteobacteria bacterium]